MKNLIYTLLAIFGLFSSAVLHAQQTVVNAKTGHASAILDLSQTTGQGFLPPKVILSTDLSSTTTPVSNPVEGLIVYNEGENQLKGYYIWNKGIWSLLATKENSITNSILRQESSANTVTFSGTSFQNINFINNLFTSTIPAFSNNNGAITVPEGRYVIHLVMNINTPETTSGSIGSRVHAHFYQGRIISGSTELSNVSVNESSIGTAAGAKSHMVSINFSFTVTATTTFNVQLARRAGGTYNGTINARDSFIHIERSVL